MVTGTLLVASPRACRHIPRKEVLWNCMFKGMWHMKVRQVAVGPYRVARLVDLQASKVPRRSGTTGPSMHIKNLIRVAPQKVRSGRSVSQPRVFASSLRFKPRRDS